MPVGKPDEDGDIIRGSRHYRGRTLGALTVWDCPGCGKKNEGRTPEQGCLHCGAGDPMKSQAGSPARPGPVDRSMPEPPPVVTPARGAGAATRPAPIAEPQMIRVLRLIEYLIKPGENADITLRRSLVGRMDMHWGTLTGTIVDSCDTRQEDLLSLARRQPGVWVSNSSAMEQAEQQDRHPLRRVDAILRFGESPGQMESKPGVPFNPFADAARERERNDRMDMPDTGPAFRPADAAFAQMIVDQYGLKLAHTFALALSQIAPELENNMEPEKFLSSEECLRLANALLQLIPDDWQGEVPPAAPGDPNEPTT